MKFTTILAASAAVASAQNADEPSIEALTLAIHSYYDSSGNGYLDGQELTYFFDDLGLDLNFADFDSDKDGQLDDLELYDVLVTATASDIAWWYRPVSHIGVAILFELGNYPRQ